MNIITDLVNDYLNTAVFPQSLKTSDVQDVSDAPAHFDSGNPQSQGAMWVAYPRCVRAYHFAGQLGCRKVVVEVL